MTQTAEDKPPALRIVHLQGGLRAFDLGDPEVRVGPDFERHHLTFPTPQYEQLYAALQSVSLETIGVDFITDRAMLDGRLPPDFQSFKMGFGFEALEAERAWSGVRNIPEQNTEEIVDVSARFTTYHRLLTLRLRDMSEAYRRCLLARLIDIDGAYAKPEHGALFSNEFQTYIEATIHAFLADAAGWRDLIAEATWRLVLRKDTDRVTSFATFLKKTKNQVGEHPFVGDLHAAGSDRGWIKVLTELRNSVIHIAPLANIHEFGLMQVRLQALQDGVVPIVHYPLTQSDGSVRPRQEPIDFRDETKIKERLGGYASFVGGSGDALNYASDTFKQLVNTASQIRELAGLQHKIRVFTDDDIVGPIRFGRYRDPL